MTTSHVHQVRVSVALAFSTLQLVVVASVHAWPCWCCWDVASGRNKNRQSSLVVLLSQGQFQQKHDTASHTMVSSCVFLPSPSLNSPSYDRAQFVIDSEDDGEVHDIDDDDYIGGWRAKLSDGRFTNRTITLERLQFKQLLPDRGNYNKDDDGFTTATTANTSTHTTRLAASLYLLGTVHNSKQSSDDTMALLMETKPDIVLVELCPRRMQLQPPPMQEAVVPQSFFRNVLDTTKELNVSITYAVYHELQKMKGEIVDAAILDYERLSSKISSSSDDHRATPQSKSLGGSKLGGGGLGNEFYAAFQYWMLMNQIYWEKNKFDSSRRRLSKRTPFSGFNKNVTFILGDRDIGYTLRRYWDAETLWNKWVLTIRELLQIMKLKMDITPLMKEIALRQETIHHMLNSPTSAQESVQNETEAFNQVFVKERDAYMAGQIQQALLDHFAVQDREQRQKNSQSQSKLRGRNAASRATSVFRRFSLRRRRIVEEESKVVMVAIVGSGHIQGLKRLLLSSTANCGGDGGGCAGAQMKSHGLDDDESPNISGSWRMMAQSKQQVL